MNVDNKTLAQLDYFRIKEDIASRCFSAGGKQILADRIPLTDPESIRVLKQEAVEWTAYLSSGRKPVPGNWEPVDDLTGILETPGAAISLNDTVILGNFCRATVSTVAGLRSAAESLPLPFLSRIAAGIPDLQEPASLIYRVIDNTGQLKDLPELREIRTNIARIRREIDGAIRRYTTDSALRDILQSDVPVLRADRQVLAVKAGSKNRIKGIIHEVSQTGQTVYIEPEDVVAKNNELIQEEYRLNAEIRRILKELTGRLAPFAPDIAAAAGILARLDASCAAARWGLEHKAVYAADRAATESPVLLQARHPVLADKAVPVDVVFPENCRMLIITGPNTGGKTVTLKTLALFILLNQSGFPVPAAEGTALPLCSGVFADIGDEQSLDQSLSTFSGHMKNIGEMLSKADSSSLVLLDELGSGTDPHEGGAVAMAVLDELLERGALVLVTTHHGILKNYGYTHETCANASAEFDEATLAPTYRIRTGIPGESRALDIARRNGLPPATADRAAAYLSGDQTDISALIRGLTQKHEAADRLEQALKRQQRELREKQRAVDLKELRLKQKELELNRDDYRESRKFLAENRRMLENLVRELREGEITREKTKAVKEYISDLNRAVETAGKQIETESERLQQESLAIQKRYVPEPVSQERNRKKKRLKNKDAFASVESPAAELSGGLPDTFVPGMAVTVVSAGNRGGVLLRQIHTGSWQVQVGSMKITAAEKDLRPAAPAPASSPVYIMETGDDAGSAAGTEERPVLELRLLGMRCEEAVKALERQLDLAAVQGLHSFSIIHGKGNGVLQQAVTDYLSHYPGVAEFHFARPEDGGTGKTYVEMHP